MELVLMIGLACYGLVYAYKTHPWLQPLRRFIANFSEKLAECTFCISFWVSFIYYLFNDFSVSGSIILALGSATVAKLIAYIISFLYKEQ